jgi:hypothetical protein
MGPGRSGSKRHTHLAFKLEVPEKPGPAQALFKIGSTGSYIFSIKVGALPAGWLA